MLTTLDIDDDVLQASKELAEREGSTAGRVLSGLARRGLATQAGPATPAVRNGVPVLPSRGEIVTLEKVSRLVDEAGLEPVRSLLDINLLIALLDPDHAFHERAHAWWGANSGLGWSSCPPSMAAATLDGD